MSIEAIVFSRDRACQLDALLRSLELNLAATPLPPRITVLWKATTPDFEEAYETCIAYHTPVDWVREDDFAKDLERILPGSGLVVFFTDDDILFRRVGLGDAAAALEDEDVLAFSLRLGLNTTHCYPHDAAQGFPSSEIEPTADDSTMRWRWRDAWLDFGYPMSLDGHVFRAADIRHTAIDLVPSNPNELEDGLAYIAAHKSSGIPPLLASYTQSALVGIPVNRVNETHPNRYARDLGMPADALNLRYLAGERIDIHAMDFTDIVGAHQELELVFA